MMTKFSNDVDILKYEPVLFGELHLPWQILTEGTGGSLNGTTFTASAADFISAKVAAGHVIYLQSEDGTLDGAFEIVSVDSAEELVVSVVRADSDDAAVAPPQAGDISYRISTFDLQATEAAFELTEYFGIRPGNPASDIDADDILDISVLKHASVFAVISGVYAMLAGKETNENFWKKSLHYKKLFEKARQRARVGIDSNGDGVAESVSVGGAVRLRRG